MIQFFLIASLLILSSINTFSVPSKATLAGGCFWCLEPPFANTKGIISVVPGYTGGHTKDPSYQEVIQGNTGHVEAVQITFDSAIISYKEILDIYWRHIDPTDSGGQFADRGSQYQTVIFFHNENQKKISEKSKLTLTKSNYFSKPIVTPILPAKEFYIAEDYHQNFYKKNPIRYQTYKRLSGRESFIDKIWNKNSKPTM